jgi:hypothetical protein
MFSGRQSHRGNSQRPRSLGCIRGGNEQFANLSNTPTFGLQRAATFCSIFNRLE